MDNPISPQVADEMIRKIFQTRLHQEDIQIIAEEHGIHSTVKIVRSEHGKFVVKIPIWSVKLFRELFAYEQLHAKIPMPKTLYASDQFLIQECVEGIPLQDAVLTEHETHEVYAELGSILKKMHSVTMPGGGFIEGDGKAAYPSFEKWIESWLETSLQTMEEKALFSDEEVKRLSHWFENMTDRGSYQRTNLLHGDFEAWNIFVTGTKIMGIIDYGDLFVGPPAFDFARPFLTNMGNERMRFLLEGYGEGVTMEEIIEAAGIEAIWNLPYNLEQNYVKAERDRAFIRDTILRRI